jgi:hypothetical protein
MMNLKEIDAVSYATAAGHAAAARIAHLLLQGTGEVDGNAWMLGVERFVDDETLDSHLQKLGAYVCSRTVMPVCEQVFIKAEELGIEAGSFTNAPPWQSFAFQAFTQTTWSLHQMMVAVVAALPQEPIKTAGPRMDMVSDDDLEGDFDPDLQMRVPPSPVMIVEGPQTAAIEQELMPHIRVYYVHGKITWPDTAAHEIFTYRDVNYDLVVQPSAVEDDWYIAWCPQLADKTTEDETVEGAFASLKTLIADVVDVNEPVATIIPPIDEAAPAGEEAGGSSTSSPATKSKSKR